MADSGPTVYATSPGAPRPRRRLVVLAAVALAVFGLGLLIGALAFRNPSRSASPTTVTTTSSAVGPGPTRIVNGVPVGYARTRAGAVAAATAYVGALSGDAVLDNTRVQRVLKTIVAADALAGLSRAYATGVALARRKLGLDRSSRARVVFRSSAIGYRVERYSDDAATVAVWNVSVIGSSAGAPPRQSWSTTAAELRWARGDWKVEGLRTVDGPVPPLTAAPSVPSDLFRTIPKFKEYRYVQRP